MDWAGFSFRCRDIPHPLSYLTHTDYTRDSLEPSRDYLEPESCVFMQSYRLKVRTGGNVDTNDSSTSNPNMSAKQVCSLQQWCRRATLKALTLQRIDKIHELPLPHALKLFLGTFSVPDDFNTDGFHMTYNFHFPNHPHHKNHRVHPARCLVTDLAKVLIKVENDQSAGCSVCAMLGQPRLVNPHQESDHWAVVNHPHIQRCFMKMTNDPQNATLGGGVGPYSQHRHASGEGGSDPSSITCYVLEFPLINLKDVILRLSLAGTYIPEFLLWDTIFRISSALHHLESLGLYSDLCEPQNFVLMADGQVKVENLLLYLPTRGGSGLHHHHQPHHQSHHHQHHQAPYYRTATTTRHQKVAIYSAPESWLLEQRPTLPEITSTNEALTVWGLGCVFYELASLCPAFLLETYTMKVSLLPTTPVSIGVGGGWSHGVIGGGGGGGGRTLQGLRLRPQTPPPLPAAYSHQLGNLIGSCLREFAEDRPSLAQITQVAAFNVEHLSPSYYGPRSLLHLLPNIPTDD